MNVPRYSMLAARLLGRHARASSPPEQRRERGLETIERALRRSSRRRLLWRAAAGLAASAAAAAVLWQLPRAGGEDAPRAAFASIDVSPLGHGVTLRGPTGERRLDTTAALGENQSIETSRGGGASVRLSTGTRIELASATTFRGADGARAERFVLTLGELSASVAKLRPGQRFVIETPDTEIEVRGTQFRLQVLSQSEDCGGGSRTRLRVSEGVVEVRGSRDSARVGAGASWPPDCAPRLGESPPPAERAHAERDVPVEATRAPARHGDAVKESTQAAQGAAASTGATALGRQNDLFAGAVAARRRGDVPAAIVAYQELISQFPSSPLVENAIVERMRLLASTHDGRARDEARRYLARYPNGFAVDEARRLVDAP
jgi:ferric-dicitrate binding protein FerR (iron transport regulator)